MADSTRTMVAPVAEQELGTLGLQLEHVAARLAEMGEQGILSITVLQREGRQVEDGWEDYDKTLKCISEFLGDYQRNRMRDDDLLIEALIEGNTFVLFISPPRSGRNLDLVDLTRVRHRLSKSLQRHLLRSMPRSAVQQFGVYVGGSLLRYDPTVDCKRIIYRSLDAAFADALSQKRAETRRLSLHLNRILQSGRLSSVYQPVVDLQRREVVGFEALTRVSTAHFPTPDLLFRVATESGTLWQLERLSRQRALEGIPSIGPGQKLFINVEPGSFDDPELSGRRFLDALERAGLKPEQLVLEMTEHVAVQDFAAFRQKLSRCRDLGFQLAMDDVGSGYAGLHSIAEIRPDFLKVDMTLVRDLHHDPIKRELISTIRRFADRTGTILVAEGVECAEELESLLEAGVRCAQGYLFARPMAPPDQPDWSHLEALDYEPELDES
jgi:EAL domain-containing protein (putative c-di-GMP-specific phosphodiesterase class I)